MSHFSYEVRALVDRIAAAFIHQDFERAREIVDEFRIDCEQAGRKAEKDDLIRAERYKLEMTGKMRAHFHSADGLDAIDVIAGTGDYPMEWRRGVRQRIGLVSESPKFQSVPMRRYVREGYAQDGLPIYEEQP